MLEQFAIIITDIITSFGYLGVFVLMTFESALIPIPSEVTMPFAGFMVGLGKLNFLLVVFIGAIGNLIGSLMAYALGYWGGETVVHNLVRKYGKYLLITLEEVETSEKWFKNHGSKIAFFSRLLPVVRTFISLPAGIAKMNVLHFSIYTFLGSFLWSAFLAWLGLMLGQNWNVLGGYFHKFDYLIVATGLILTALYVYHKIQKIKKASRKS